MEGEDLKVQSCPAPNRSSQGMQEGNEYGWHAGHVTLAAPKRSTIPVLTDFLAATGRKWGGQEPRFLSRDMCRALTYCRSL